MMQNKLLNILIAGILIFVFIFGIYQSFVSFEDIAIAGAAVSGAIAQEECGLKLSGQPSISAEEIDNVLKKHKSPAFGTGKFIYDKGFEYGIDPVFALAWFAKESTYGKAGVARNTRSIGNIKHRAGCDSKYCINPKTCFCGYSSWESGIESWYKLITGKGYIGGGLDTVEKILPKYCPAEDKGCNPIGDINFVRDYVKKYRDVPCLGLSEIEKGNLEKSFERAKQLVGTYLLNPSFSIQISYPLGNIKLVEDFLNAIEKNCYQNPVQEPIKCITEYIKSNPGKLEFAIGPCGSANEVIFEHFIENYYDCLNSEDNDCVCEFSPFSFGQKTPKEFFAGEYKIKICNKQGDDCKGRYIKLEEPKNDLVAFNINNPIYVSESEKNSEERGYIDYFLKYNDDGSFKEGELGIESPGPDTQWGYNTVKLYKGKEILVIIKENLEKRQCNIPKKHYRFCAVDKNKKVQLYREGKIISSYPEIRFALYINDLPPPIIKGINLLANKRHDKLVIVSWQESEAGDIAKYRIYHSTSDFFAWKIKNHRLLAPDGIYVGGTVLNIKSAVTYKNIVLAEVFCDFSNNICKHKYKVTKPDGTIEKIVLEPERLYFIEDDKRFLTILKDLSDAKYYFAVTAIDGNDNEINNFDINQKLALGDNFKEFKPIDNLAPGIVNTLKIESSKNQLKLTWDMPENNIDGSKDTDSSKNSYKIYYELQDFSSAENLKERLVANTNSAVISLDDLQANKEYFFGVSAVDKLGNEHKDNLVAVSLHK